MTDPVRVPFPVSAGEIMDLREVLVSSLGAHRGKRRDMLRRLEDFYSVAIRAEEAARHARAMEAISARPKD